MAGQKEAQECTYASMKVEDGKTYICNKKGKWELYEKDKTIEGGVRRISNLPKKEKKSFLTR